MTSFNREALWDKGEDETVQVNQRALIDKVLARYSGEFTVFRELLQNSDDATSKNVEIHFQTEGFARNNIGPSTSNPFAVRVPDLNEAMVAKWCFKNDGMVFREEDWNRLKKIAEGNPDEDKIGAFGVGFYSLFSVTEEPFVTSGDQWMGFYWKGDQLVARKGQIDETEHLDENEDQPRHSQWTTFDMPLREATIMPKAFDFIQFLCSSLTFMAHLSSVSVFIDNTRLAHVTKSAATPKKHILPDGLKKRSNNGIMRITGLESTALNISASILGAVYQGGSAKPLKPNPSTQAEPAVGKQTQRAFFSSILASIISPSSSLGSGATSGNSKSLDAPPPLPKAKAIDTNEILKSSILLTVFSAQASVSLERKLSEELHRSTKKNPPKTVVYNLIYTGKDAFDASTQEDKDHSLTTGSVFQGLRADLYGTGSAKIFIGHATGQTTGIGGHMAARFIPTVERESIDLVDKNVAVWNKELLFVGGYLARAAYELEMEDVKSLWMGSLASSASSASSIDPKLRSWLQNRCAHAMRFFSFHASTPSGVVSNLIEESFYGCSVTPASFRVISTHGVLAVRDMRMYDPTFAKFIKGLPVVPSDLEADAPGMLTSLRQRQLLKPIVLADILNELRSRPLEEQEMVECLRWWFALDIAGHTNLKGELRKQFLDAALVSISNYEGKGEYRVIPLSSIRTFVGQQSAGSVIPVDDQLPLPSHTFPYSLSRHLANARLLETFFGWEPLDLPAWLSNILNLSEKASLDVDRATQILQIMARSWGSLDAHQEDYT